MTCALLPHDWGRWIRGRRTKVYFRFCRYCGSSERSTETPEGLQPPVPRQVVAPSIYDASEHDPDSGTYERTAGPPELPAQPTAAPERFNKFRVAGEVRQNILGFRKRPAS